MSGYIDLPSEIRQRILGHLIPDRVIYQIWPVELVNLFLVSKQFLMDTTQLLQVSPPLYVATSPSMKQCQFQICPQQQTSTLCLSLFDSADIEIDWITTWGTSFVQKTYTELLQAWTTAVPQLLTSKIKTVVVDATIASARARRESPEYLAYLVNEMDNTHSLLHQHRQPMFELFEQIADYSYEAKVRLIGVYSIQQPSWREQVASACRRSGLYLEVKSSLVGRPDTLLSAASLTQAVKQMRPDMEDLGQDLPDRL